MFEAGSGRSDCQRSRLSLPVLAERSVRAPPRSTMVAGGSSVRSPTLHLEHLHTAARLWTHPRASREEVARFRDRKLRVLVSHAQRHVPLYARLLAEAGVVADDVRGAADLVRLPVTTKALMRATPVPELLVAGTDADRLMLRYTTGSTGEPMRIRRTELEDHLLNLFRVRALLLAGGRLRDRRISVASRGVPTDHKPSSRKSIARRLGR
jgi:phenylacetate-coenzyme A ligase PaaK-like adenylate-forming protein